MKTREQLAMEACRALVEWVEKRETTAEVELDLFNRAYKLAVEATTPFISLAELAEIMAYIPKGGGIEKPEKQP